MVVDRQTERKKDRQTDRQTDKVSYRGTPLLKTNQKVKAMGILMDPEFVVYTSIEVFISFEQH